MQASISSGCRNDIALHGGWDAHSSALGYQTQHYLCFLCLKTRKRKLFLVMCRDVGQSWERGEREDTEILQHSSFLQYLHKTGHGPHFSFTQSHSLLSFYNFPVHN
jgi:hypothetical protein